MDRRAFLKMTAAAAAGLPAAACVSCHDSRNASRARGAGAFSFGPAKNTVRIAVPGLGEQVRIHVVGDTHFGFHDARDDAYADFYARMARYAAKPAPFEKMLAKAKKAPPDLMLLVGDIVSFPTLANVEYVSRRLEASGLNWHYVAGNHDWHFEGVPGSDAAQRAEWAPKRLAPLYCGRDPLMSSQIVKGVRFVAIDNSIYHVDEAQLEFWKAEAAKGDPIVLFMHIPLWVPGWGLHTCGCRSWGAASDPYWKIERREKWAASQSPSTFAFREAVLATPNLVAVFSGHIHSPMIATERGKFLFSVPKGMDGDFFNVTLAPSA